MTKFKSFISWFPKFFEKATHEENLKQISESLSNTLVNSKMNGDFLTPEDISFVLTELRKDLKLQMEIKLSSEKSYLESASDLVYKSKTKISDIKNLIKSL